MVVFRPFLGLGRFFSWKPKENATMLTDEQQACVNLAESGHNLAILGQVSTFSSFIMLPIFPHDEHEGCWHINHRVLFSLGPVLHLRKHRFEGEILLYVSCVATINRCCSFRYVQIYEEWGLCKKKKKKICTPHMFLNLYLTTMNASNKRCREFSYLFIMEKQCLWHEH